MMDFGEVVNHILQLNEQDIMDLAAGLSERLRHPTPLLPSGQDAQPSAPLAAAGVDRDVRRQLDFHGVTNDNGASTSDGVRHGVARMRRRHRVVRARERPRIILGTGRVHTRRGYREDNANNYTVSDGEDQVYVPPGWEHVLVGRVPRAPTRYEVTWYDPHDRPVLVSSDEDDGELPDIEPPSPPPLHQVTWYGSRQRADLVSSDEDGEIQPPPPSCRGPRTPAGSPPTQAAQGIEHGGRASADERSGAESEHEQGVVMEQGAEQVGAMIDDGSGGGGDGSDDAAVNNNGGSDGQTTRRVRLRSPNRPADDEGWLNARDRIAAEQAFWAGTVDLTECDDGDSSKKTFPLCTICLTRPVNACVAPCHHASFCWICINNGTMDRCPICRNLIETRFVIYM